MGIVIEFVIDRIEGNYAVCEFIEGEDFIDIPIEILPEVDEGDILEITIGEQTVIKKKSPEERLDFIKSTYGHLWN